MPYCFRRGLSSVAQKCFVIAAAICPLVFSMMIVGFARPAKANVESAPVNIGGYFRVMTRPDLQGGDGKLGYYNLYGRLLNEGPYAALELRMKLLEQQGASADPWTSVHFKIEGGSLQNAEPTQGGLMQMRLSQGYVLLGNVLLKDVVFQLGTLDSYFGDLGLYDSRPAQIFYDAVGLSARYQYQFLDVMIGAGDSGYGVHGFEYNTVFTTGGSAKLNLWGHGALGAGAQMRFEPGITGNRFAPYQTTGVTYEDYRREEVYERYVIDNPSQAASGQLPAPSAKNTYSYKLIGYLGFGNWGPLRWNSLYLNFLQKHPENSTTETYLGEEKTIYIAEMTDEQYQLNAGNELYLTLWPDWLDLVWGVLAGYYWDVDNTIAPDDAAMEFASTVGRIQFYMTPTFHLLGETSVAWEHSRNGSRYRNHQDSIFASSDGKPDARGLEFGDSDTRVTWQGKGGLVFNPFGPGVYMRPSLRILYGVQYSTQNRAYGNSFVEDLDQFNYFGSEESHWHHVVALEAEAWF
jgi:hypothetical protein